MKRGEREKNDKDRGEKMDRSMDDKDGGERRGFQRKRGCRFCGDSPMVLDHKDRHTLSAFITERFRIVPRRLSGCCAFHQRELTKVIKRARHLAILPYATAQL